MPNNGYFDIERDIEIEKAGSFWCHGCLMGKPAVEQSPDDRYCQGCYRFLLAEAELDSAKRGEWIPRVGSETPAKPVELASGCNKIPDHDNHRAGRPKADVSVQKVAGLKAQGYSLRDIATQLEFSHMTIQRILSRQRVLVDV